MTEKINPATGEPHVRIKYSKENLEVLGKLQAKITAVGEQKVIGCTDFLPEEVRIAATTPFAMVNMQQRILGLNWEDKKERLDELSEYLSEACKRLQKRFDFLVY